MRAHLPHFYFITGSVARGASHIQVAKFDWIDPLDAPPHTFDAKGGGGLFACCPSKEALPEFGCLAMSPDVGRDFSGKPLSAESLSKNGEEHQHLISFSYYKVHQKSY